MNLNSIAVGLYLAFTLSQRINHVSTSDSSSSSSANDSSYNLILSLIMISSIATSFFGKYLSNRIVSCLNCNILLVHGDQPEGS
jgi:hypothetical protein